jgi:glycosyltransferase involved in cell wall biosynthesis
MGQAVKIAFVAYDLNPKLGSEGGNADIWLKILSKHYTIVAFTQYKHKKDIPIENYKNVEFIFIDFPKWPEKILRRFLKNGFYPLSNCFFTKRVKKIIRCYPDINLIHCITPAGIHSFNTLYHLKIPIISGPIGGALDLPKKIIKTKNRFFYLLPYFLRKFYFFSLSHLPAWKQYFNSAQVILIGTEQLKAKLPIKSRDKTIIFFDTTVDPNIFRPTIRQSESITICYIGRLEHHKGIDLLIESFESLLTEYTNLNLFIAGEGSCSRNIPSNNPKIHYFGRVTKNMVVELLNRSDIFCLPTLREPGGSSILEAMSCGLPVVTTNYGGPSISVSKECGFKITPTNRKYFLKQLKKYLKILIDDPDLRAKMGAAGRERIQKEFSPKAIEEKIINIYENILGITAVQNNLKSHGP